MAGKKPFVDTGREAKPDELPKVKSWLKAAIPVLRKNNNAARGLDDETYKGIHVNYGGLRVHFGTKFPELSLTKVQKQLAADEFTASVMVRGGPMIYFWADRPENYKGEPVDRSVIDAEIEKQLAMIDADNILAEHKNDETGDETSDVPAIRETE